MLRSYFPVRVVLATSRGVFPGMSGRCVWISKRMDPSANTSLCSSALCESAACSGDMYPGVPSTSPMAVSSPRRRCAIGAWAIIGMPSRGVALASPQSRMLTSPKSPSMTFEGLRSR